MKRLILIAAVAAIATPAYAQVYPDPRLQAHNPWAVQPVPDPFEQQREAFRQGRYGPSYEQHIEMQRAYNESRAARAQQNPNTYRQPGVVQQQPRFQDRRIQPIAPYNYGF